MFDALPANQQGGNSTFYTFLANGGAPGYGRGNAGGGGAPGFVGGSGGGGADSPINQPGGASNQPSYYGGATGYGNAGGTSAAAAYQGGGGGAGAVGGNGNSGTKFGGAGGAGRASNILNGYAVYFAGGGGGAGYDGTGGTGGIGGGGNGGSHGGGQTAGVNGLGGGGGGADGYDATGQAGGAGGQGVIIIRYTNPQTAFVKNDNIPWVSASGCWTYTDGTYNWTKFNTSTQGNTATGSWTPPANAGATVTYMVVAGGGAGGGGNVLGSGAGGGAGGIVNGTMAITSGTTYTWQVGAGGPRDAIRYGWAGQNGFDSFFNTATATGGGGGASTNSTAIRNFGLAGGSGGGSTGDTSTAYPAGANVSGQGFYGGVGIAGASFGGGGGGAGGPTIKDGYGYNTTGGNPKLMYIGSGTTTRAVYYATGGSGGGYDSARNTLGDGGYGASYVYGALIATNGTRGSGSGGGGGALVSTYPMQYTPGQGGDGVIILRYTIDTLKSSFSANITQFVTPQTVQLTVDNGGVIPDTVHVWWGDGSDTTGTSLTPTHLYGGASQQYSVMVVTSASGKNDSVTTQTNYLTALPKIANWIQPTGTLPSEHTFIPITLQSTTNFTSAYGPNSYVWTFDNGTVPWTQSGLDLSTTYWNFTKAGLYTLSLNVTNVYGGNTTTIPGYIQIIDIPTASALISSNQQYITSYQGNAIKFNDTSTDEHATQWVWDWGDGLMYSTTNAVAKNTTHVYNSTGTYQVSLSKTNAVGVTTTNSTPADYINIQIPTMTVANSPSVANRNMTGLWTYAAQNISRADDISWMTMYNFTQVNVTSIQLNGSAPAGATLNAGWSSPGTIRVNVTSPDMTYASSKNYVDVYYRVKDMTNYSATYGMPWMPINLNGGGSGTQTVIGNKTLYGSTNGQQVPTYTPGYALFTNNTFTKLIKFYNNVNNQKITGQAITVQWIPTSGQGPSGTGTTTNGEYTISGSYDPLVSVTAQATGYYNGTATYVWNNTNTESQFLTPLSGASGSTVWYTPKQVRFKVVDGNNNPLPASTVSASFVASTLPSSDPSWLQTAYGISRSVAEDMMSSALAMSGTCGQDGYVTFTMHGSLAYNMTVTNTTSGVTGWYRTVYPMDNEYILRVSNNYAQEQVNTNSYTATVNNTLWAQAITPNVVRVGLNFTDTTGRSTNVRFMVWDAINGTVYNTNTSAAPGTSLWQPYFDLPNVRGNKYLWNYTAVRT